jgi:gas vesicle protein
MTDPVALAIIQGGFGVIIATVTTVGAIISRKARDAAREAARKVDEVRDQAVENGAMSKANHVTLTKVIEQTDGNVRKLQEMWAEEARRRESEAWAAAFEAGRLAEMTKNRRKTDSLPRPVPANDEETKE